MQTTSHPLPNPQQTINQPTQTQSDPQKGRNSGAIFDLAVRECRYCLGGEGGEGKDGKEGGEGEEGEGRKERLWEPCGCEGAVQLVHEGCFLEWLESRVGEEEVRERVGKGETLGCRECSEAYIFQLRLVRRWCAAERFRERARRNLNAAVVTAAFLILDVLLLGISCGYAISDSLSSNFDITKPRYYLVYAAVGVCLASLLFVIYQFVIHFCKHEQLVLYRRKQDGEAEQRERVVQEGEGQSQHGLASRGL